MLKNIKITVDAPVAIGDPNIIHTGTSYQVSKIPDFTKNEFIVLNVVNDTENLLHKRFEYELADTQALYIRTKYHYNNDRESNWSKVMPLRGDQIGIKLSNSIVNTPKINADIVYSNNNGSIKINTSKFSLFAGVGKHTSSTYEVVDTDGVVYYSRKKDVDNLTLLTLPLNMFDLGKSYIIKVKYHTEFNTESNFGKCLLTIDTKENAIFDLELPYYFVPMRRIWFKLNMYTPRYKSIDIRILDKYKTVVATNLDQMTMTPNIYTGELTIGETYTIEARIEYLDGTKTRYITTHTLQAEKNVLMKRNKAIKYLAKHNFTQYLNTNGECIQNTYESYSHGILLGKSYSNDIYRYRLLGDNIYELEKAFTLENIDTIHKAFINIVPLHSSRLLVDFSDGTTGGNIKSPAFRVYDYNVITQTFIYAHEVIRDNEKYSTAVSASLVPMIGDNVYYIPAKELLNNDNNGMLTLRVYNAYDNTHELVDKLPVNIKKYGNLIKISEKELLFFGGVNEPISYDKPDTYLRTNNDLYLFNINLNTWTKINELPSYIPETIYNFQAYVRKDNKVVLFNACELGDSVGNQNTYVYDINTNTFELEESDMSDDLKYNSSVIFQDGDIGRISNNVIDPQKLFTYISNTKTLETIEDENTIDTVTDLVVHPNEEVTIESPYRYNSITILGNNYEDSGVLHWIKENEVVDFLFKDLIVTRDTQLTNNLYSPLEPWDSVTILDGVDFSIRNVLWVPDDKVFTIDAPFQVEEIVIGDNSELIVNHD